MTDRYLDQVEAAHLAKRSLHREEMNRFGDELAWLQDPARVPEGLVIGVDNVDERCFAIGDWMLTSLARWSGEGHSRLTLRETFEKYELQNDVRVTCRQYYREIPHKAYAPGMAAVSEVVAASTKVAARENIPQNLWADIAMKASAFGEKLSRDGTHVQGAIRNYLRVELPEGYDVYDPDCSVAEAYSIDPAKMKLDEETGITTVTPIDDIVEYYKIQEESEYSLLPGVCVALQAKAPASQKCPNFFKAVWKAYVGAAERLVYPNLDLQKDDIALEGNSDPQFDLSRY